MLSGIYNVIDFNCLLVFSVISQNDFKIMLLHKAAFTKNKMNCNTEMRISLGCDTFQPNQYFCLV